MVRSLYKSADMKNKMTLISDQVDGFYHKIGKLGKFLKPNQMVW